MEFKLIEAVKSHPCLFDKSLSEYKDKLTKENAWIDVAASTGTTITQCQKRWRSLRDRFVKEFSTKQKSEDGAVEKHRWAFLDAMSFMQDHIAPRSRSSNIFRASTDKDVLDKCMEPAEIDNKIFFDYSSTSFFHEGSSHGSVTNEQAPKSPPPKRQKLREAELLLGTVLDILKAKTEDASKSRNTDYYKVLDSYLVKHSEEEQDRLKIEILNMVFSRRSE